ncbi:MAG: hypothetical protein FJ106_01590 [Deltaproteobacteria bacterium]|nr:hypothetical protein [Deltaproteobacteria bacterium]
MKDFRIDDIIRYLITGIWIFFLLDQNHVLPEIIKFDKELIVFIISFSIGAVAYSIFRTFLYPFLQMGLDRVISGDTGRNYIKKQFRIKEWRTRNDLWVLFQQKYPDKFPGHYTIWLSSFLTMYTLSISTLVAVILSDYCIYQLVIYIGIFIVLLGVGIFSNINYEYRCFNNTLMISNPTFKEFVQEYLTNKSKLL